MSALESVLQLHVRLKGCSPPIWRRLLICPDATFWELHIAIQGAMGWRNRHLHEFIVPAERGRPILIGIPFDDPDPGSSDLPVTRPGWDVRLNEHLDRDARKIRYVYDFGDYWVHEIRLEKFLRRDEGRTYPVCVKGRGACPPEDIGGINGYGGLLEALEDPTDPEHDEVVEWVGEAFDPDRFDADDVVFEDPEPLLREILEALEENGPPGED